LFAAFRARSCWLSQLIARRRQARRQACPPRVAVVGLGSSRRAVCPARTRDSLCSSILREGRRKHRVGVSPCRPPRRQIRNACRTKGTLRRRRKSHATVRAVGRGSHRPDRREARCTAMLSWRDILHCLTMVDADGYDIGRLPTEPRSLNAILGRAKPTAGEGSARE